MEQPVTNQPVELVEKVIDVGGIGVVTLQGGSGRPLLMLHDELGFPGWMRWNEQLAASHRFVVPLQPGFGRTPRIDWFDSVRDVASFYARMLRESGLGPVDVVGFSAGGWIAAEMAACDPGLFDRMVLVAPLGIRPAQGEILDFLAITMRRHVIATVSNQDAEELTTMYGGGISPEQFELFEAARAETSRLAWEPFMFDPTLPHRLAGVDLDTLVIWGERDKVAPRGCAQAYAEAIPGARLEVIPGVGHRPEIEARDRFVKLVSEFLEAPLPEVRMGRARAGDVQNAV
jgi:pimeloyl-ACP methyl ester carboxylesterase